METTTSQALEAIRSFHGETENSRQYPGNVRYLPDVSDETKDLFESIVRNCRLEEDVPILLYYVSVFRGRYQDAQLKSKRDLDYIIWILPRVLKHRSCLDLKYDLAEARLLRARTPKGSLEQYESAGKDFDKCIKIARKCLPRTRQLLGTALQERAEFHLECEFASIAYLPHLNTNEDANSRKIISASRRMLSDLREAILYFSEDGDTEAKVKCIQLHLKSVELLCAMARVDPDRDETHLANAKTIFDEVWSDQKWIFSADDIPPQEFQETIESLGKRVIELYGLTGGGSEYLQRVQLLFTNVTSCKHSTPKAIRSVGKLVGTVFNERFTMFHAAEDLHLSIHHWEHAVAEQSTQNSGFKIAEEAETDLVILLMQAYENLSFTMHEHDEVDGLRIRDCAEFLFTRGQTPPASQLEINPSSGYPVLLKAVSGYLGHFNSRRGHRSKDEAQIDSLRKAASILFSEHFLDKPAVQEGAYLEALYDLAITLQSLFVMTSNFDFLRMALLSLRSVVHHCPGKSSKLPRYQTSLARLLFLSRAYSHSQPTTPSLIETKPTDAPLKEASSAISDLLRLGSDSAYNVISTEGTQLLPQSLDARLAITAGAGDESYDWLPLLRDAVALQRYFTSDGHHCQYQSSHSFKLVRALTTLATFSFHDPHASGVAFKEAIGILQHIFFTQPSVRLQQSILENRNDFMKEFLAIPSQAAAYAISWGNTELAVEFLEYGRTLVWSRMRGFRAAETELNGIDEHLRCRFIDVCKELEDIVTQEIDPDPLSSQCGFIEREAFRPELDQPIELVERRKALEKEFYSIVKDIQKVHGYEDFLQMTAYRKLRSAASEGPIIILSIIFAPVYPVRMPNDGVMNAIIVPDSISPPVSLQLGEGNAFEVAISEISYSLAWIRASLSKVPVEYELISLRSTLSRMNNLRKLDDKPQIPFDRVGNVFQATLNSIKSTLVDIRDALQTSPSIRHASLRFREGEDFVAKISAYNAALSGLCDSDRPFKSDSERDCQDSTFFRLDEHKLLQEGIDDVSTTLLDIRDALTKECNRELKIALEKIGELVVKKIVNKLRELGVKEQSRIWWCPTTGLSAFPLHAAIWKESATGKKSTAKPKQRCLSDFYVSSYTPSLTTLIQARSLPTVNKGSVVPEVLGGDDDNPGAGSRASSPSMLIVGQQDMSLATVSDEIQAIETEARKAGCTGDSLNIILGGSGKLNERDMVLDDLAKRSWVHFACHGIMGNSDPFASHFQIRNSDGKTITLMDIIRSKVPNAEFAFLSACHSAEQSVLFSQDQAIHLAAAMQFSGFRSVVGTMWPLKDDDGPPVAKAFYKYIFSEPKPEEGGEPEVGYKRAARALREVVQEMRKDPRGKWKCSQSWERWVNFVHIGA